MGVQRKKQVNYLRYMDERVRIAHEAGSLEYVPDKEAVDLTDELSRHNLKKQIRMRKRVMCGLHEEIRELEELLNEEV